MNCPNCGASVTDDVVFCPCCGQNVTVQPETPVAPANEAPATPVNEAPVPEVAEQAQPLQVEPVYESSFAEVSFDEKPAKKKKSIWKVLIPCTAVVTALAVLIGVFFGQIQGFFIKTFGSDEAYLKHVEEKAFNSYAEDVSKVYGTYTGAFGGEEATSSEIRVNVSNDALDMLDSFVGENVDFDWINDIVVRCETNTKDGLSEGNVALEIGGQTIADMAMFADMEAQELLIGITNLSDEYLRVDLDNGYSASMASMYTNGDLIKALPNEEQMNKLLTKYISIALDNIDDAEKSSEKLEVGDISQKVTALEFTIDMDTAAKVAEAVLEEAKSDKDLKNYINNVAKFLEDEGTIGDSDDVYDEFKEGIDSLLDELDEADFDNEDLVTITDYVDGNHEIIGREIEVEGETVLYYATATKGKKFAREIVIGDMVVFSGEGTKKGKLENAEYVLEVNNEELLTVSVSDFNPESEDGLNGKFVLKPSEALLEYMDLDSSAASAINTFDLGISLDFSSSKGSTTATIGVVSDGKALVELIVSSKTKSASKVSMPDDDQVVDAYDVDEWLAGMDFDELVDALEKTDIPDEFLDVLSEAVESIAY